MRLSQWVLLLAVCGLSFAFTTAVLAQSGTVVKFIVANTIGFERFAVQVPVNLSSVSLVTNGYINADGLNTNVETAGEDIGYMPGTDRVRILACFNDAAVDQTTACNNDTPGDITLPSALTEVYEFAGDNQFRHLWLNISTSTNAVWTLQWQYYDGTSYVALSNVGDATSQFTIGGLHPVSWSFPAADAWPEATLHGVEGYWVRVEVTSFTSLTVAPLGRQAYYETGRWWSLSESLDETEQQQFDVQLGLSSNPRDFHYYFPHTDGIIVTDDATLEITGSSSVKVFKGYFDVTAPVTGTKSIAFKDASVEITIPSDGVIQVQVYP